MHTYESIERLINDGAETGDIEAALSDEHTALTDRQIADLRAALAERDAAAEELYK